MAPADCLEGRTDAGKTGRIEVDLKDASLTTGSIPRHLFRLTLPTIGGAFALTAFHLTDTYFVSRLGTDGLAAMGFTFPVVMVIGAIAMGAGMGASSALSRAIGKGDHHLVRRIATDGVFLACTSCAVFGLIGLLTMDPLFRALGASGEILVMVKQYMRVWYLGVAAAFIPMVGDSCLRATGDMVRPLLIMLLCATLNLILDPIFIFGLCGFPRLEMTGAALATVLSRCIGMAAEIAVMHYHAGLLAWERPPLREVWDSWRRILHVGIPAAATHLLMPISRGIIVRLVASAGGACAVAAVAAGSRIERFAMIIPMAFGIALVPLMGQNWGRGRFDRVEITRRCANRMAVAYGAVSVLACFLLAHLLARLFSRDPVVVRLTVCYLSIVPFGHIGMHASAWTSLSLNAIGKPNWAAALNVARIFVIVIPCALVGRMLHGYTGMLVGLAIGQALAGVLAFLLGRRLLRPAPGEIPEPEA